MKMRVIAYNEGKFVISPEYKRDDLEKMNISIGIAPVLRYRKGSNLIGTQISIEYNADDKPILIYDMVLSISVEGWNDFMSSNPDKEQKENFMQPIWEKVKTNND